MFTVGDEVVMPLREASGRVRGLVLGISNAGEAMIRWDDNLMTTELVGRLVRLSTGFAVGDQVRKIRPDHMGHRHGVVASIVDTQYLDVEWTDGCRGIESRDQLVNLSPKPEPKPEEPDPASGISGCETEQETECEVCGEAIEEQEDTVEYDGEDAHQHCVTECDDCGRYVADDVFTGDHGEVYCDECWDDCSHCGGSHPRRNMRTFDYDLYCDECWGYCPDCDSEIWGDRYEVGACEDCHICCESPQTVFRVPFEGGVIGQDERVTVSLPAGVVSDEGMEEIRDAITAHRFDNYTHAEHPEAWYHWSYLAENIPDMDSTWQMRDGNLTKRISRMAYKKYGLKVPPELMSQIGNIASQHSDGSDFEIEVTRDLNLPSGEFCHEDSCWWGSYVESRCVLKTNGGFGIRSFGDCGTPTGRAWVMPLKKDDGRLCPTFETLHPEAYVVFNGYEELDGYRAARVLAQMVGGTYRKIGLEVGGMYINSQAGYLVAREVIASQHTDGSLNLSATRHSDLWENESLRTVTSNAAVAV